jgi:hypothetical protein
VIAMYDAWKCASPEEGVELEERWDDVTSVEECAHGEHPLECSLCTSAGTIAAVSGEGEDDMAEELKSDWNTQLSLLLDEASDLQLKSARYAVEREEKKRLAMALETIRALDPDAPKPRKTRSDAGTTRVRKEQAA